MLIVQTASRTKFADRSRLVAAKSVMVDAVSGKLISRIYCGMNWLSRSKRLFSTEDVG